MNTENQYSELKNQMKEFLKSAKELKEAYEQICADWNDAEQALVDLSHFREFLELSEEGILALDAKRYEILCERRALKAIYSSLVPYMESIGKIVETHEEYQENVVHKDRRYYGIRSVRGFNTFHDLQPYCEKTNDVQCFADVTHTSNHVKHIYALHTEFPDLFEKKQPQVKKKTIVEQAVASNKTITELNEVMQPLVAPPESIGEHFSYADFEARAEWRQLMGRVETPEQRKKRIESELQNSIVAGIRNSRRKVK